MLLSQDKASARRQAFLYLVGRIESQLRDAFTMRCETGELTQALLAKKLGVGRSVINRRLKGQTNMTIETVADLVWALDMCIDVDIYEPVLGKNCAHFGDNDDLDEPIEAKPDAHLEQLGRDRFRTLATAA